MRRYPTSKGKGEAPARRQESQIHIQNQTPFLSETLRGLKQILCTRTQGPHRDSDRTVSVSCGGWISSGLRQRQGLWVKQTWVWQLSWRRSPLIPPQSCQNLYRLGNRFLEDTNKILCTRTQEKGAVTPQETDKDLPVSVQGSLVEVRVGDGLLHGWGH